LNNELPPWLVTVLLVLVAVGVITGAFILVEWALTIAVVAALVLAAAAAILTVARRT
jgi:hypothetical protein